MLKEDCPKGESCGVHYRTKDHVISEDYIGLIDYVGEYAVTTLIADEQFALLSAAMGQSVPDFTTRVIRVGDKALGDFIDEGLEKHVIHTEGFDTPDEFLVHIFTMAPEEWMAEQEKFVLDKHNNIIEMVSSI